MSNRRVALLRLSLGFVWIYTGVLCLAVVPIEESAALVSRVGLDDALARWTVWITSGFEILLGLGVIVGVWPRVLAIVQIVLISGFTILISLFLPEFWLHPFGPVSKNVVLLAAAYALGYETPAECDKPAKNP